MEIKRIFIVEDDQFFADSFTKHLLNLGDYEIYHFLDVESALGQAEAIKPNLIFLDNHLKEGSDGVQTIPMWRKILPKARIAVITSNSTLSLLERSVHYGVKDFFNKDKMLIQNTTDYIEKLSDSGISIKKWLKNLGVSKKVANK